jgi:hypothetical protein
MKQHRLDVFALCTGVFFTALAVGFVLDGLDSWGMDVTWIAPMLLIALGLGGVLSTLGRATSPDSEPMPPASEPRPEPEATP